MESDSPLDRPQIGPQIAPRAPALRARITNHKDLLPGLDGRTSAARRFRDLVNAYVIDQGGLSQCSEVKIGLLRRLAAVTVQAELLEAKMINGEPVDVSTLCTLASTVVRISQRLGLNRVPRNVTPSLQGYLTNRTAPIKDEMDVEPVE